MKIVFLLLLIPSICFGAGDLEGFFVSGGSTPFHEDDFTLGSRTTDVTGSGDYWDNEIDSSSQLAISGNSLVYTISSINDTYVKIDNDTSSDFLPSDIDEFTLHFTFSLSSLSGFSANGQHEIAFSKNENGKLIMVICLASDGDGDINGINLRSYGDVNYLPTAVTYSISTSTTYHVWCHFKAETVDTEADGIITLKVKPAGGSWTTLYNSTTLENHTNRFIDHIAAGKDLFSGWASGSPTITYNDWSIVEGENAETNY